MSNTQGNDPFFRPIGEHVADDAVAPTDGQTAAAAAGLTPDQPQKMVEEIESLCMRCELNGTTRLLMTYIPYFKEVLVASFLCDHCGERNNEIQSAGQIQGEWQMLERKERESHLLTACYQLSKPNREGVHLYSPRQQSVRSEQAGRQVGMVYNQHSRIGH